MSDISFANSLSRQQFPPRQEEFDLQSVSPMLSEVIATQGDRKSLPIGREYPATRSEAFANLADNRAALDPHALMWRQQALQSPMMSTVDNFIFRYGDQVPPSSKPV